MQTSPVKPALTDDHVVRIPDAHPRGPSGGALAIAAAVVVALVLGLAVGYAWERRSVGDSRAQAASALIAARDAQAATDRAAAAAAASTGQLSAAREDLRRAVAGAALLRASRLELRSLLADSRASAAELHDRLVQLRAEAAPLSDGTHIGRIWAVGALQSPPHIVFDTGTWFRGGSAQAAAAIDGVIGPNDPWPPGRYFRNRDVRWSAPRLAASARVTLWNLGGNAGKHVVGIGKLQWAFTSDAAWARGVRSDPFWVTVRGGVVVKVVQQRYR